MTSITSPAPLGRSLLSPAERQDRQRVAKRAWKAANRPYVNAQIDALASRPEYKARRRLLRGIKRQAVIDAGGTVRPVGRPRKVSRPDESSAEQKNSAQVNASIHSSLGHLEPCVLYLEHSTPGSRCEICFEKIHFRVASPWPHPGSRANELSTLLLCPMLA